MVCTCICVTLHRWVFCSGHLQLQRMSPVLIARSMPPAAGAQSPLRTKNHASYNNAQPAKKNISRSLRIYSHPVETRGTFVRNLSQSSSFRNTANTSPTVHAKYTRTATEKSTQLLELCHRSSVLVTVIRHSRSSCQSVGLRFRALLVPVLRQF